MDVESIMNLAAILDSVMIWIIGSQLSLVNFKLPILFTGRCQSSQRGVQDLQKVDLLDQESGFFWTSPP